MVLTKEIFIEGKSLNNGYSSKQLDSLGIKDFTRGWPRRIIGKDFPEKSIELFLSLKNAHLKEGDNFIKKEKHKQSKRPSFSICPKNIEFKEQYTHPNWQKMRLFILNRDKFTCIDCCSTDKTLHVHHLKYLKRGFIWDVPTWYLVTLCEDCHSKEHGRDLTIKH